MLGSHGKGLRHCYHPQRSSQRNLTVTRHFRVQRAESHTRIYDLRGLIEVSSPVASRRRAARESPELQLNDALSHRRQNGLKAELTEAEREEGLEMNLPVGLTLNKSVIRLITTMVIINVVYSTITELADWCHFFSCRLTCTVSTLRSALCFVD